MPKTLTLYAVHGISWCALRVLERCTRVVHRATGDACYYGGDTQSVGFFYIYVTPAPGADLRMESPLERARSLRHG